MGGREHVVELTGPIVGQQRVDDRAHRLDRYGNDGRLVPVRELDRHHVARRDAVVSEGGSHPTRVRGELGVRLSVPGFRDDGRVVRSLVGVRGDPPRERGVVPQGAAAVLVAAIGRGDEVSHRLHRHASRSVPGIPPS